MKTVILNLIFLFFFSLMLNAQSASVSPSRLYFKVAPGGYKSQKIKVTNNGMQRENFKVTFGNFSSDGTKGKTQLDENQLNEHGCSQWLSATPSFFEVAPGETKDVEILLQVPNSPDAYKVRWSAGIIKLTRENTGNKDKGSDVVGMQINQSFQFVFHVFQTPPSVTQKTAEISKFEELPTAPNGDRILRLELKNTGESIVDCVPYIDITNLSKGDNQRIKNKPFTVLPGGSREIEFVLPNNLSAGKYSVMGVVDYGSDSDLAGAELSLEIK